MSFDSDLLALMNNDPALNTPTKARDAWKAVLEKYIGSMAVESGVPSDLEVPIWSDANQKWEFGAQAGSSPHKATHENTGSDEISVAGLSGLLATPQTPAAHQAAHENTGADEINVGGLSGELADNQPPKDHASKHGAGGTDLLSSIEVTSSGVHLLKLAAGLFSLNTRGTTYDKESFHIRTMKESRTSASFAATAFDSLTSNGDHAIACMVAMSHKDTDVAIRSARIQINTFHRKSGSVTSAVVHGVGVDNSGGNRIGMQATVNDMEFSFRGDGSTEFHSRAFIMWIKGDLA